MFASPILRADSRLCSDGQTLSSPTKNAAGMPESADAVVESVGLRLKEMGQLDGGFEYRAVNAANARFEKP